MKHFLENIFFTILFFAIATALGWVLLSDVSETWTPDPAMTVEQYSETVKQ